ncbi:DUF4304 domain-containing protein [uncultured Duncaniella sp.]|uniref:DUF4304 domain-containing protein n=1 Tax=uncultured Duncaniella sp. TaxID=2768039 RepID=UPI002675D57F|nr:DUF4304 domain-containing protein [uncultured Duncaniella sp.]
MKIHLPEERFLRHGMIIMLSCAVVLLGIGIFMFIKGGVSSGYIWPRFTNPKAVSITWHTPVFAGLLFLLISICFLFGSKRTKRTVKEKQAYVFDEIKYFLQEKGFRKRGYNFFKKNGEIGYCVNIQNDKCNNNDQVRFTLNVGIFTDVFWLEHFDFKHTGVIPTFPKEYDCAIRKRISELLPDHEDKWYSINAETDIDELWNDLEQDLTEYIVPFFSYYNQVSDVEPDKCIYKDGGSHEK